MRKPVYVMCGCAVALLAAVGAAPRYLEELCIGGGVGDSADGGADFEKDGDIVTDGHVTVKGDLAVGANEASDHVVALTAGSNYDAVVALNEVDTDNGGSLWYDGSTNTLRLGTRNGTSSALAALSVAAGSSNVTVTGDAAVNGGDITSSQAIMQLDPSGVGRLDVNGSQGKLRLYRDGAGSTSLDYYMWNDANSSTLFGEIFCLIDDATSGSEDGKFSLCLRKNGSFTYNLFVLDSDGNASLEGGVEAKGGGLTAGQDSLARGILTAWDGNGGNAPGCVRMASPNGTVWYLFVEDDGTLKVHSSLPTQNSDGTEVGSQS